MTEMTADQFLDLIEGIATGGLFVLVWLLRGEISKRIDQAEDIGDGPMVNALCAEARKLFTPGTHW